MKKSILIWENNNSNKIYYTTNDGNIINVYSYWQNREYKPIINEYDKEKNQGVMVFKNPLTEIPGISGNPFFNTQRNLLTLKLPKTITRIGRGAFWDCSNLEYINLVDLVNLDTIEVDAFWRTNLIQMDFRNTKLEKVDIWFRCALDANTRDKEYVLFPQTIKEVSNEAFSAWNGKGASIKTLMITTLSYPSGNFYIEDIVTENLIINKFDGLGDLHNFNGDVIIWVPDEFYDGYVEKYTNYVPDAYLNKDHCEDILSRLKKYSDGVPQFPYK